MDSRTLGLHPLWLGGADDEHVDRLRDAVRRSLDDARFVAVGEIIDLENRAMLCIGTVLSRATASRASSRCRSSCMCGVRRIC
jgi:hypothetical protein